MKRLIPVFLISIFLLSSCLFVDTLDDTPGGVVYSDGTTYVQVIPKSGSDWLTWDLSSVYVKLDANSSTGYEWECSVDGYSISSRYEDYTEDSYLLGAGGTWSCTLGTTGIDGTSVVTLRYSRPWDSNDVVSTRCFSVTVDYGTITDVTVLY